MTATSLAQSNATERPREAPAGRSRHEEQLDRLAGLVAACRVCPSMEGRRRVLSRANGDPDARILFVAEAPGRLGGEITGVPLQRDQSGKRFEHLLQCAGLSRQQVFITNAVLCNPRSSQGHNRPPSANELRACSSWLAQTLDLVQPRLVVTLGAVALAALDRVAPHGLVLRADVGRVVTWCDGWLVPMYHPSPRAGLSRGYAQQAEDFSELGRWLRGHADVWRLTEKNAATMIVP